MFRRGFDPFFRWKASLAIVVSVAMAVLSGLYATSAAMGHLLTVVQHKNVVVFGIVLTVAVAIVNEHLETLVVPRFEREYLALGKRIKVVIGIAIVVTWVLILAGVAGAAVLARGLR
jgi:predicted membrane-bound mannosyltransferase